MCRYNVYPLPNDKETKEAECWPEGDVDEDGQSDGERSEWTLAINGHHKDGLAQHKRHDDL